MFGEAVRAARLKEGDQRQQELRHGVAFGEPTSQIFVPAPIRAAISSVHRPSINLSTAVLPYRQQAICAARRQPLKLRHV